MDGFTSIPIQNAGVNTSGNNPANSNNNSVASVSNYNNYSNAPYTDNAINSNGNNDIELTDDTKKVVKKNSFGFLFPLSILSLLAVFGYFGYLVFLRWTTLQQVTLLSEDFQVFAKNVNKNEIEEFLVLDNSLKAINEKLGGHTQVGGILSFVNRNIRSNVQITDYRIENREKEVSVALASIAPTFRELAEQTEKMAELKTAGAVKDFTITQMALEADGRKVRYTLNLTFDKDKISVAAIARQNAKEVEATYSQQEESNNPQN